MDELGAGTDPGEGMGIAIAVLEEVYKKGATILATTHYSEIKEFAMSHEGFKNGCMEFDINTLKPLYRLSIGKAGESNALLIALRLGMNEHIIERAHEVTYKEKREYKKFIPGEIQDSVNSEELKFHEERVQKLKETVEKRERVEKNKVNPSFSIGDCVYISSMGRTGIVYETESSKGEVGVMVMKKKFKVNRKRLSIYIDSSELYPEDYDFDIVFESKENRKKDKLMSKHHIEGLTIEVEKQD
jgi:dsDNA-specific endonuclease/ATPase MutS2